MSQVHSTEIWMPIPEFPGYEVSSVGRVRSKKQQQKEWRLLRSHKRQRTKRGLPYIAVALMRDGKAVGKLVHVLVLTAFVGPAPEGMECRHLDGNPSNNRLANLRWGTHQENMADRKMHGRLAGENHSGVKLTNEKVRRIRRLAAEGWEQEDIAALPDIQVSRPNISLIVNRRTWRHVEAECPQSQNPP